MNSNTKLRQKNLNSILRIVREKGPISKRDMQKELGLSWGTISTLTNEFYENEYIIVADVVPSNTASRTDTVLWDVNSDKNLVIGIDLTINQAIATVTDLKGRTIDKEVMFFKVKEWDAILEDLYVLVDPLVDKYTEKQIMAISFSAQGVVDTIRGVMVMFKKWSNIPIKKIFEERYNIPTFATHDTDCLMRCEQEKGLEEIRNADNALLLRIGTGAVGMAIMIDRKPYIGASGRSGEFGRILVNDGPEEDRTFVEWHICCDGIVRDYCRMSNLPEASVTFEEVVERAYNQEPIARLVFQEFARYLGEALINTVNLFDPEVIALHGPLGQVSDLFLEKTQKLLDHYSYGNPHNEKVQIRISQLDADAGANGAALIAIDRRMDEIIQQFDI